MRIDQSTFITTFGILSKLHGFLPPTDPAHYVSDTLTHHRVNQKCPYISKTPLLKIAEMYNELVSAAWVNGNETSKFLTPKIQMQQTSVQDKI